MRALLRRFAEQNAIVGDDANWHAFDVRKTADQGAAEPCLEFIEIRSIDDTRNDFAHVIRLAGVGRYHAVQLAGFITRGKGWNGGRCHPLFPVEVGHGRACQCQSVRVVLRQVIGHSR